MSVNMDGRYFKTKFDYDYKYFIGRIFFYKMQNVDRFSANLCVCCCQLCFAHSCAIILQVGSIQTWRQDKIRTYSVAEKVKRKQNNKTKKNLLCPLVLWMDARVFRFSCAPLMSLAAVHAPFSLSSDEHKNFKICI